MWSYDGEKVKVMCDFKKIALYIYDDTDLYLAFTVAVRDDNLALQCKFVSKQSVFTRKKV